MEWKFYLQFYTTTDFPIWLNDLELKERYRWKHRQTFARSNSKMGFEWIEKILKTSIEDGRKNVLFRVLCSYAVNVLGLGYDDAFNLLMEWLDKCNEKERLTFNPKAQLKSSLNSLYNRREKYLPIGKDKFREGFPCIYLGIFDD